MNLPAFTDEAFDARRIWWNMRNAYTMGTCRIGADPQTPVVNAGGCSV